MRKAGDRLYPERDKRILALYATGLSYSKIAVEIGLDADPGRSVVSGVIRRHGVKNRGGSEFNALKLEGKRFGQLLVLRRVPDKSSRYSKWLCRCDCGFEKILFGNNLRNKGTKACIRCAAKAREERKRKARLAA